MSSSCHVFIGNWRQLLLSSVWRRSCPSVHSGDGRSSQSHGLAVDAGYGKRKCLGGGGLTFPGTCRGVQIHVSAGLCRQSFRLKMLENALFEA